MPACDLVIDAARVIDGSGGASRAADVAIDGDRIVEVGDCSEYRAQCRVDARGLALAPGFIDSHTHDDLAALKTPDLEFKISQGVTTVIAGNCGLSIAPLDPGDVLPAPYPLLGAPAEFRYPSVEAYVDALRQQPCATNLALLAGHSNLRLAAMSDLNRAADEGEIKAMRQNLRLALKQGCIGLSTGLGYPPAIASSTDEVVELARVLNEFDNAVYATHMRDESDQVIEAISETFDIGRRADVQIVISHYKCAGARNFGRSRQTLAMIDAAISDGQRVGFDMYPYSASSTSLLFEHVRSASTVLVAESETHPEFNGQHLDRIAASLECSIEEACERLYPASAIYFDMADEDVERIMSHPAAMIGSDGIASMKSPHPRLWGTFPRVLGHYVREKKLFDLETAVHKMTALPAQRFTLEGRGRIEAGYFADLVLFDADKIIDRASFENPLQASDGVHSVWVNGKPGWVDGAPGRSRNGRFLTH